MNGTETAVMCCLYLITEYVCVLVLRFAGAAGAHGPGAGEGGPAARVELLGSAQLSVRSTSSAVEVGARRSGRKQRSRRHGAAAGHRLVSGASDQPRLHRPAAHKPQSEM